LHLINGFGIFEQIFMVMDKGNWLFYGLIALSGIVSLVQKAKKKTENANQENQDSKPKEQPEGNIDTWIKTIIAQASPSGELDNTEAGDDFIPRNPKSETLSSGSLGKQIPVKEDKVNINPLGKVAEDFRRKNESLEDISVIEGFTDQSRLKYESTNQQPYLIKDCLAEGLDPTVDLMDDEEIKRAIIYGEIFRTKF
jgi:hypothetical protein